MSTKSETFTHRKINVNCEYETESQHGGSIGMCIKLTLDSDVMACEGKTVDTIFNITKFRNCDVGGDDKPDAEIKCFISDKCNSESPTYDYSAINITKFSICDGGEDVGEGNLTLYLDEPGNNDAFDPEDDNEIDIELEVGNLAEEDLPIVVEAWLYDIDGENGFLNITSEAITIEYPGEETFELMITIPNLEFSENNRLYYKAYVEHEERNICISDSIRLYLEEEGCVDADGDDYCEENDCDDTNSSINPGEFEICTDSIDNDCDGFVDSDDLECTPSTGSEIPVGQSENLGVLTRSGKQRVMNLDSRADFKIKVAGEQHSATVKNVTSSSVTLTISSIPFDIFLIVGQTKAVDVDDNNINDLAITLNGIENGKADLTFRNIFVAAGGDDDLTEPEPEPKKGMGFGWFIFIFILIIGIAVVIALIYLRRKRQQGVMSRRGGPGAPMPPRGPRRIPPPRRLMPTRPPRPVPVARTRTTLR